MLCFLVFYFLLWVAREAPSLIDVITCLVSVAVMCGELSDWAGIHNEVDAGRAFSL